jgi:hypothetical protein
LSLHQSHAYHNEAFTEDLSSTFPCSYYDWKITSAFYSAYHWLKALAEVKGINIGNSHGEIRNNVNPASRNEPAMAISRSAYQLYDYLYDHSKMSRYMDCDHVDYEDFLLIMEADYASVEEALLKFKKHIDGLGNKLGLICFPTKNENPVG